MNISKWLFKFYFATNQGLGKYPQKMIFIKIIPLTLLSMNF